MWMERHDEANVHLLLLLLLQVLIVRCPNIWTGSKTVPRLSP